MNQPRDIYKDRPSCAEAARLWLAETRPGRRIYIRNFVAMRAKESEKLRWRNLRDAIDNGEIALVQTYATGMGRESAAKNQQKFSSGMSGHEAQRREDRIIAAARLMLESGRIVEGKDVSSVGQLAAFSAGIFNALLANEMPSLSGQESRSLYMKFIRVALDVNPASEVGAAFENLYSSPGTFRQFYGRGRNYALARMI